MIKPTDIPNLRANERGYATGDTDWPLARVRITPVHQDQAIAASVNAPAMGRQIVVQISASLCDADGAVLTVGGRLLVADTARHAWRPGGAAAFEPEAWLTGHVAGEVARLISVAHDLMAADAAGFLVPPPAPIPAPAVVEGAESADQAVADRLAAMAAQVPPE